MRVADGSGPGLKLKRLNPCDEPLVLAHLVRGLGPPAPTVGDF